MCGIVRTKPKFTPDAVSMMLFGPGVNAITQANDASREQHLCRHGGPLHRLRAARRWRRCRCATPRPGRAAASARRSCSILSLAPVISNTKLSVVASITRARKASASRSASTRCSPLPRTLTIASSRSIARPGHGHVDHAVDRHQALELVLDLLDHHRRAARDDGDAREMLLVLGLGHRQEFDIVAAAGEQPDDARQHARLVVDQHRQRVGLDRFETGAAG